MKPVTLPKPEIALIALTRAILGIGIGLVVSDKLSADQRRAVGWALIGVGVVTTFPLLAEIFGDKEDLQATTRSTAHQRPE